MHQRQLKHRYCLLKQPSATANAQPSATANSCGNCSLNNWPAGITWLSSCILSNVCGSSMQIDALDRVTVFILVTFIIVAFVSILSYVRSSRRRWPLVCRTVCATSSKLALQSVWSHPSCLIHPAPCTNLSFVSFGASVITADASCSSFMSDPREHASSKLTNVSFSSIERLVQGQCYPPNLFYDHPAVALFSAIKVHRTSNYKAGLLDCCLRAQSLLRYLSHPLEAHLYRSDAVRSCPWRTKPYSVMVLVRGSDREQSPHGSASLA